MKVSIVIVTMNHLSKLKNLLDSLFGKEQTKLKHEVIVVDNCSEDGTVDFVRAEYPNVIVHENEQIKGFAANNNKGVSLAKGEYVFICNPDIIVFPGSIDTLIRYHDRNPSVGIVCPQLLNSDKTYQASVRRFMNAKIIALRVLLKGNDATNNKIVRKYLLDDFDKSKIQPVDWAMGAALVLKRDFYLKLKGFDERFFLYVEDVDLCLRSWKLGFSVVYNPEARMIHDHQRASFNGINRKSIMHLRSMIYFLKKHKLFFSSPSYVH
ncbi:glycosyltransferase family 2 protein [Pontibacter fetidus]|uniref:Glycosyltransferase family 2 protein n=1 Tax=Pontibacter fetidus TaxID=2700082 RepID=A0A6B2H9R9_9BACT|nr:glycosyltransferase family 2 protein [Pontibacter fetidus]NDK57517.1 glycosyltransferase family 2 protein [Pontibacter fetidus]